MRNYTIKTMCVMAVVACCVLAGCGDDEDPIPTVAYRGVYRVYRLEVVGDKTDSVILTIENNRNYSIENFDADIAFCNSAGVVEDFGSNFAFFDPMTIDSGNCDVKRLPRGEFHSDFVNHGDTIWLDRLSADSAFSFRLIK